MVKKKLKKKHNITKINDQERYDNYGKCLRESMTLVNVQKNGVIMVNVKKKTKRKNTVLLR